MTALSEQAQAFPAVATTPATDTYKLRLLCVVACGLAAVAYHWTYVAFLNKYWAHAGFDYDFPDPRGLAIAYFLAILPSLWMPITANRPSQYLYWLVYLMVYIPSELTAALWRPTVSSHSMTVMLLLTAGLFLVRLSYLVPPYRIHRPRVSASGYWAALSVLIVLAIIFVLTVYATNIQFVSLYESNELRGAAREIDADSPIYVNYSLAWLGYTLFPLIAGYGLYRGKRLVAAIGLVGSAMLYTTAGLRIFLFAPLLLMTASLFFRTAWRWMAVWAPLGAAAALALSTLASLTDSPAGVLVGTLIGMRSFGNNGLLTNVYAEFFAVHPLTYLSHLRGFNLLIPYPYSTSLGFVVGEHFFGFSEINANANMWATDGLAAFGPLGLLFVGLVVSCVFWLLDSVTHGLPLRFAALVVSAQGLGISNLSLFSILLGGGMGLMMLLLYLFPAQSVTQSTPGEQPSG